MPLSRLLPLLLLALAALCPAAASAQAPTGPQLGPGALNRYVDPDSFHRVEPGIVRSPFKYEGTLGYLLPAGGPGRRAIYGCDAGGRDQFLSTDRGCEGRTSLGAYGFVYETPPDNVPTVAVHRCLVPGKDHFASTDPGCEGQRSEGRLGYLRARGDALLRLVGGPHRVTAGPVDPSLTYELGLGSLFPAPGEGRRAIHGCAAGDDQFLSLDPGCEGRTKLGIEGYAYDAPPTGEETRAVYRCYVPGSDHFASFDPGCEGQRPEGRLGYTRTYGDALVRYENPGTGTSWVTPGAVTRGYRFVRTLGFLVRIGGPNLQPIYGCAAGEDRFLSLDAACEGRTVLGRYGFAYAVPPSGEQTVALYRCNGAGRGHFASVDPNCEGAVPEARLGFVRTTDEGPLPAPACGPTGATVAFGFGVRRLRSTAYASFGRSAVVSGRAVGPDGAPAAGAQISILADAGTLTEVGRVPAGPDGGFTFSVPPGPSRVLRAAYRASPGDPALACSAEARLRVRAGITLRVSDRRVRNRQRVRFSGEVLGEPIPRAGKLVTLQARVRGRWVTFATPRSTVRGVYRASYRFKTTRRTTTFSFRARAPRESAFPYARGTSKVVKVRVRAR